MSNGIDEGVQLICIFLNGVSHCFSPGVLLSAFVTTGGPVNSCSVHVSLALSWIRWQECRGCILALETTRVYFSLGLVRLFFVIDILSLPLRGWLVGVFCGSCELMGFSKAKSIYLWCLRCVWEPCQQMSICEQPLNQIQRRRC